VTAAVVVGEHLDRQGRLGKRFDRPLDADNLAARLPDTKKRRENASTGNCSSS
jgi:hypothetical protein